MRGGGTIGGSERKRDKEIVRKEEIKKIGLE
jgi:hypothetical protein